MNISNWLIAVLCAGTIVGCDGGSHSGGQSAEGDFPTFETPEEWLGVWQYSENLLLESGESAVDQRFLVLSSDEDYFVFDDLADSESNDTYQNCYQLLDEGRLRQWPWAGVQVSLLGDPEPLPEDNGKTITNDNGDSFVVTITEIRSVYLVFYIDIEREGDTLKVTTERNGAPESFVAVKSLLSLDGLMGQACEA